MEKINEEEANKMMLLTNSREILVSAKLKELKPGEALKLLRTEWKASYAPSLICRRLEKKYNWKFRVGRLLDNSGWLMQRLA